VGEHVPVDEDTRQWPPWLMAGGVFATILTFWWVSSSVLVSYWIVGRLFCAFGFAGNLLYGRWIRVRTGFSRGYWFMFNMLAIGPTLFCAFFLVNRFCSNGTRHYEWGERSNEEWTKRDWMESGRLHSSLTGPGIEVTGLPLVRAWDRRAQYMRVDDGLFGFPVITGLSLEAP
jgi:hypothetical protein